MDLMQIANATAAWVDVWRHGSAHPSIVLAALRRLAERVAPDPQAAALVEDGRRVVASVPFGSIQAFAA